MTQLHPRDPENSKQNWFSKRRFSKKKTQLQPVEWETNAKFVSVDLIGEKNQVILEYDFWNKFGVTPF